jgi:hypothetical protein
MAEAGDAGILRVNDRTRRLTGTVTLVLAADPSGAPYLAGIVLGFALGVAGQLLSAQALVVAGIIVILITTLLFIIATDPSSGSF